jgi:hypothetical protein
MTSGADEPRKRRWYTANERKTILEAVEEDGEPGCRGRTHGMNGEHVTTHTI